MKKWIYLLFVLSSVLSQANQETIAIRYGWQQVGLSGYLQNINDLNRSFISIAWMHQNGYWKAYSGDDAINKKIIKAGFEMTDLPQQNHEGIWILSKKSGYLRMDTNACTSSQTIKEGWNFLGTATGISSMDSFSQDFDAIWSYNSDDKKWKVYSHNQAIKDLIKNNDKISSLDKILPGSGFWVKANKVTTFHEEAIQNIITQESNESAPTNDAYDYDSDHTALYALHQKQCNEWQSKFNTEEFNSSSPNSKIDKYLTFAYSAMGSAKSEYLIYAPRGGAGDFTIDVTDGSIELFGYKLPGDVDGDFNVTNQDLKSIASMISLGIYIPNYDVNKDGSLDSRDLLYAVARLGSQVSSFDFYTADGKSLGISPIIVKSGNLIKGTSITSQKVRVIARDENGASSSSNINITKDEWYKSYFLGRKRTLFKETNQCNIDTDSFLALLSRPEKKYVIGVAHKIALAGTYKENGIVKDTFNLSNCFNNLKWMYLASKTHKDFVPTNMGYIVKFGSNDTIFVVEDGYHLSAEVSKNLKLVNEDSMEFPREIHSREITIKKRIERPNKPSINIHTFLEITSVYIESDKKYNAKGDIKRNASDKYQDCGNIKFNRFGPAQQRDEEEKKIQNNGSSISHYSFDSILSMGHYNSELIWPYGNDYPLGRNFIVKKEGNTFDYRIPWQPKSVKGHLYDPYNNPIPNKKLTLVSTCDATLKKYTTTKDDGSFEFKDVDIGEYKIVNENGEQKAIVAQKGSEVEKDIKDKSTWKITVEFVGQSGVFANHKMKIVLKNIDIKLQNPDKYGNFKWYHTNIIDNSNDKNLELTGITKLDLNKLEITDKGIDVSFNTYLNTSPKVIFTIAILPDENINKCGVYGCAGHYKEGFDFEDAIKKSMKFSYYIKPSQQGDSYATITFEPCENSECEDKVKDDFDDFDDFDTDNTPTSIPAGGGLGDG
jgi:hypothetical protein